MKKNVLKICFTAVVLCLIGCAVDGQMGNDLYHESSNVIEQQKETQNQQDPNVVKPVTFSLESGSYEYGESVTLSCSTPDAQIYYTLDGSDPITELAYLYTEPIVIDKYMTIVAVAKKDGLKNSNLTKNDYRLNKHTVEFIFPTTLREIFSYDVSSDDELVCIFFNYTTDNSIDFTLDTPLCDIINIQTQFTVSSGDYLPILDKSSIYVYQINKEKEIINTYYQDLNNYFTWYELTRLLTSFLPKAPLKV